MYSTVPYLLRAITPGLVWQEKTAAKELFLTFDDGPHPVITPMVLDLLDEFNAKATFFCVGENVKRYPQTYEEILKRGHRTGNHTFNHLDGWSSKVKDYQNNVYKASGLIDSNLFRPPYGKINPLSIRKLKRDYRIIMWSVISYDFDKRIVPEQCLNNVLSVDKPGTIAVFHDSEKASDNLFYALPRYLEIMSKRGYSFELLHQK